MNHWAGKIWHIGGEKLIDCQPDKQRELLTNKRLGGNQRPITSREEASKKIGASLGEARRSHYQKRCWSNREKHRIRSQTLKKGP